ncbi:hypothetical protein OH764_26250 [Burkholderia sp. M6-3]
MCGHTKPRITRDLDRELWNEVKLHIDSLPKDSPHERERYLCARCLFTLFYLRGLRIAKVGGNTLGGFFYLRDADGHERWWLEVLARALVKIGLADRLKLSAQQPGSQ